MASYNDNMIYLYVLAPVTLIVAVGVVTYIQVQSRRLRREIIESGQFVAVVPAVIAVNQMQGSYPQQQDVRSPDGLPPAPPYSKY